MRVKNSLLNIIYSLSSTAIIAVLQFVVRTIFIRFLSVEYLGINSLFASILQMLSLAELGVGTAIIFSLYKPLLNDHTEQIKNLMKLYQKIYMTIGGVILLIGVILSFFIDRLVSTNVEINLQAIFILFLINTSFTYFFGYKRSLIKADQKAYLLVPFTTIFLIMTKCLQLVVLIKTGNYYLFLVIEPLLRLIENIVINKYIEKKYPYLKEKPKEKLPDETKKEIVINTKAMVYHKLGDYVLNGTDSILISSFIGIWIVGLYANYLLIISVVSKFVRLILNSVTSSFGNLIAEGDEEKKVQVFLTFNFVAFWLLSWSAICLFILLDPFITLWLGEEFLLGTSTIILIVINFYLTSMRIPIAIVKSTSGIYNQDKFLPIGQSVLNLFFSFLLVRDFGLNGIFMGTLISSILPSIYRPVIVYKYALKGSIKVYFYKFSQYALVTMLVAFIANQMSYILFTEVSWINFIIMALICLIIPNVIIIIFFYKTAEFKKIINILGSVKKKVNNR